MTPPSPKCPLQLNDQGRLRHFLSLDGLPRSMLTEILDTADSFLEVGARAVQLDHLFQLGANGGLEHFEVGVLVSGFLEALRQRLEIDLRQVERRQPGLADFVAGDGCVEQAVGFGFRL